MTQSTAVHAGYAAVNGLQMYYEIHGAGEPLVLPLLDKMFESPLLAAIVMPFLGTSIDTSMAHIG